MDRNLKLPNAEGESKAYWTSNGCILQPSYTLLSFFYMSLKVEQEKKSWEDAVEHCRESYTDLTSLLSETEIQLAQNHIRCYKITELVWISLRYLGDLWLWVNCDPLVYTAWSPNRDTSLTLKAKFQAI
uniref:C-type lectin domain-containing protein n=1 Tax=Amphiprion ocellaris TaxID=80972 RepID=A0AAQ5ZI41_AMPOC